MDLYLHTDVSKYRYIQSVNLLFTTVSPLIYSLSVDGSATVKQAGWLHNETIQKKSQIPTIYLVLKQKVVSSIVPICSFCLFVSFPFVHYFSQLKVLIYFFIASDSLVHWRAVSKERRRERWGKRSTKERREWGGEKKREKGGNKSARCKS